MSSPVRDRHLHDPWAPRRPDFPRRRLLRAGVSEESANLLEERYDDMAEEHAGRWVSQIRSQNDSTIRGRFVPPDDPAGLEDLKQEQLRDLAAALGVSMAGSNEDLRARITGTETPEPGEGPGPVATPGPSEAGEPAVQPPTPPAPAPDPAAPPTPPQPADGDVATAAAPETAAAPPTQEIPAQPAPPAASGRPRSQTRRG